MQYMQQTYLHVVMISQQDRVELAAAEVEKVVEQKNVMRDISFKTMLKGWIVKVEQVRSSIALFCLKKCRDFLCRFYLRGGGVPFLMCVSLYAENKHLKHKMRKTIATSPLLFYTVLKTI